MTVIVGNNAGITAGALPDENSWDVWMNKNLRLMDVLLQGLVLDKDLNTPPGSPTMGDLYIVGPSPTGTWASQAGKLAVWTVGSDITSVWVFITPKKGWEFYVSDENKKYLYDGTAWIVQYNVWDSGGRELVGLTTARSIAGASRLRQMESSNGQASYSITRNSPSATGPVIAFGKTRGSLAGDVTAVTSGDELGLFQWGGADGATVDSNGARLRAIVDGAVSTGVVPGRFEIDTANSSGVLTNAVKIDSLQNILIGGSAGGYKLDCYNGGTTGAKLFRFKGTGTFSLFGYSDTNGVGICNTDPFTTGTMVYLQGNTNIDFYLNNTNSLSVTRAATPIASLTEWNTKANVMIPLLNPAVRFGIGYTAADVIELQGFDSSNNARDIVMQRYGGNVLVGADLNVTGLGKTGGYTVGTLPAGVVGQRAYVTDALAPAFGSAVVGGGVVVTPVFRNATVWIVA